MIKKTLYLYEYIGMYSVAYNNLYNKQLVNKIGKFQSIQSNKSGYVDPYQEPIYLPLKTIVPKAKKHPRFPANRREL